MSGMASVSFAHQGMPRFSLSRVSKGHGQFPSSSGPTLFPPHDRQLEYALHVTQTSLHSWHSGCNGSS